MAKALAAAVNIDQTGEWTLTVSTGVTDDDVTATLIAPDGAETARLVLLA